MTNIYFDNKFIGDKTLEPLADVVPSFFSWRNQGPLTLTLFLHAIVVLLMI